MLILQVVSGVFERLNLLKVDFAFFFRQLVLIGLSLCL
jgi:hypothetical protein